QASIKKNPVPEGAGFFALCVRNHAGWFCRPGKRSATGHGRPHDPTVKRSKNTKEGIYKRRKAKTQP
ncbi:hypothetical protein, partial [Enterobacter quasiroggenkampii]|uniref:hypothetical protein n=1 Tax=Enterobacter quasiroggenkampii TaxID=2497436 RepID=UPI0021D211BF